MSNTTRIIAFIAIVVIAVASLYICFNEMQNAIHFFENINLPQTPFNELYFKTVEFMSHIFNMTIIMLSIAFAVALIVLALECSLQA